MVCGNKKIEREIEFEIRAVPYLSGKWNTHRRGLWHASHGFGAGFREHSVPK
ncbi:hypothetical protein NK8_05450 [Caballeronia sp. NK8]|nr:hypothetical protein NK8_05450 [Caballeronia sp. NK8]